MILLQSQDAFDQVAILEQPNAKLRRMSKQEAPRLRIRGHFSQIGENTLCLYRSGDRKLHFRIDEQDMELDRETIVNWTPGLVTTLAVERKGEPVLTFKYERVQVDAPLENDPTPMIELEDFDFGLFVANVTQDPSRRDRIYLEDGK